MTGRSGGTGERRLTMLRRRVERTDDRIVALLRERMRLARAIGAEKAAAGLPILDAAREARVVRRAGAKARELGVPSEEVRTLFWGIIALCREEQIAVKRGRAATGAHPPRRGRPA